MKKNILLAVAAVCFSTTVLEAQGTADTLSGGATRHYMPLYLDIPAELNVPKGYKEFNIGAGYADFKQFSGVRTLVEFDFSPVRRLGFEIEVPFIFVHHKENAPAAMPGEEEQVHEEGSAPESAMALRVGFSYTLATFKQTKMTIAAGYFNELESSPFRKSGKPLAEGNVYNPFLVIAKVWGGRLHSMLYTGPAFAQKFETHRTATAYRFNTIVSYRFGKGNKESFAGLECNQIWAKDRPGEMVLRPQVQIAFTERWLLGFVTGIPVAVNNGLNGSGLLRLIYSMQ